MSSTSTSPPAAAPPRDLSSLGNPHQVRVTHLDWTVKVDFDAKIFGAKATYTLQRRVVNSDTDKEEENAAAGSKKKKNSILQLDTAHLLIQSVTDQDTGKSLSFELKPEVPGKPHLGRQLEIDLSSSSSSSDKDDIKITITIDYQTTPASSAIQWLPATQTAGKKHPYLFTQCQAIHARSMVPCQDQPGVKMTYTAAVTVPSWAVCVMSALREEEKEKTSDDATTTTTKTYIWNQPVPISSYLLAMAVGDLVRKDISPRVAIWSEPALSEAAAYEFGQTEEFLQMAESLAGYPYVWGRYDLLCLPPSFPYGGMENPCLTTITPTLLAGDRSLADVVAHEISHSWTGNLVTNATWDHFWLNEGWTTWFQRKIMARIHKNDQFLDFDALGGYKMLQDTIDRESMPRQFTKLVLPIGDLDPDDAYSSVAYEKGFNLLWALERRVGKEAFEAFFQAYIKEYANKTLTSEDFKDFFLQHFAGSKQEEKIKDIDWDAWFYAPGMPPEEPNFDRTLAQASEQLASDWIQVDRKGAEPPSTDIKAWSSDQITCFLDALQTQTTATTPEQPLQCCTLDAMDKQYEFSQSKNSEILFRYCQLAIAAEDETMLMVIMYFCTSQGRMKFVRPLYRALYASKMGKQLAVTAFLQNKDFYHPICAKMIASDLKLADDAAAAAAAEEKESSDNKHKQRNAAIVLPWAVVVGAAAATIGLMLSRRNKG